MPENRNQTAGSSGRLDVATSLGILLAVGAVVGGLVLEGGKFTDIKQGTAALIVLGGTLGAVLVTTPWHVFRQAVRRLSEVVLYRPMPFAETLETLVRCATRARRGGLNSLEADAKETSDDFLRKALELAADGNDSREIDEVMRLELEAEEDRLEAESQVWESAAGYSPTIGIIGAVLGLIQVMKHLENIEEVGKGIAVAFVATIYGVAAANILFLPAAGKLGARNREKIRLREMMLHGVSAITEGMNPQLIRIKLQSFVTPGAPMEREPRAGRTTQSSSETSLAA